MMQVASLKLCDATIVAHDLYARPSGSLQLTDIDPDHKGHGDQGSQYGAAVHTSTIQRTCTYAL